MTLQLPDFAPVPEAALGPALNERGYFVGPVERNLYWVTDGTYQSAFLTTSDGVVLLDAPPTIGHNIQRAVDEIAAANGVSNKVTHLIYSHHHADHGGASSLFDGGVARVGHEETRALLLRDDDPARPAPEETFADRRTLEIGGERIELAWHGTNHSPDNIFIHLPDHDTLMLVDIVNPGWAPVYQSNLTEDVQGYIAAPATALGYSWTHFIGGHMGRLGTRDPGRETANYMADIADAARHSSLPTHLGDDLWMTWNNVRELRLAGMTIGGHTVRHPLLARLTSSEQVTEIRGCHERLFEMTGVRPKSFSYPVGKPDTFNTITRAILLSVGFEYAFSFYGGYQNLIDIDLLDIKRVNVGRRTTQTVFESMTSLPSVLARFA